MATAPKSNYANIETAVQNLVTANLGWACVKGDYDKLLETTPLLVITHGEMQAPLHDRMPQYELLEWLIPLRLLFDYTSDIEAHELFRAFRVDLVHLFMVHRRLDDGNTPYPPGMGGQCLDCKLIAGDSPRYPQIDGRPYVMADYILWVKEQLQPIVYP